MTRTDRRLTWPALFGGLALLLGWLFLLLADPRPALAGWLAAFLFAGSLPLGSLLLVMMMHLIPGQWAGLLEADAQKSLLLLPAMLVLILPVLFGVPWLYSWPDGTEGAFKSVYLTLPFFALRSLLILAGACILGWLLLARPRKTTAVSAAGVILLPLLHSLLVTDWVTSLDPHFHSSGFPLYVLCCQAVIALTVLMLKALMRSKGEAPPVLGGLLLSGLLLWAYFAFMPYFIMWSTNLVPGVEWYARRAEGLWGWAEYLVAVPQLGAAFLLLFPPVRCSRSMLAGLAVLVLLGKAVEMAWLVLPEFGRGSGAGLAAYGMALAGQVLLAAPLLRVLTDRLFLRSAAAKEAA